MLDSERQDAVNHIRVTCTVLNPPTLFLSADHRIPTDELTPVRLSLTLVTSLIMCLLPSTLLVVLDRIAWRRIFPTSATTLRVSSCDKCTSYVSCLWLLLTMCIGRVAINVFPDDVLLFIFHFLRQTYLDGREDAYRLWHLCWRRLVHVCPRWRSIVFASPNSLDLRLVLGPSMRVELLGIWPPLPIIVTNMIEFSMPYDYDFDAAIVNHNRVCDIGLHLTISQLRRLVSGMQKQFPALIYLKLGTPYERGPPPPLPDTFLGGSAPRLRCLMLNRIPFPALPRLLVSATDLVRLALWDMPDSGYISPEAIVTSLAVLANLKFLTIEFKSSLTLDHDYQHPPLPTRIVLPVLTRFEFQGVSKYLEDFMSRIDAPLLDALCITLLHQFVFDTSQLARFMRHTTRFQALNEVHVYFDYFGVLVESYPPTQAFYGKAGLRISCKDTYWDIVYLTQVLTSLFPSIYIAEHLYIHGSRSSRSKLEWRDNIEDVQWLEIFLPFTDVKKLYVCKESARRIAPALQELREESMISVLPALESLFLEELQPSGPVQEAFSRFVTARQLYDRPVAVSNWDGR